MIKLIKLFFRDMSIGIQEWVIGFWRHKNYQFKKKEAIRLCLETRKKYYVVRSTSVNYVIFSSDDVKMNKKKGVFKKDLTFIEMSNIASLIVWPDIAQKYILVKDDHGYTGNSKTQ